jgi:very-short-patch-repair endonuclease
MSQGLPKACREVAQAQEGVISRRQAIEGGMSPHATDLKVRSGRWQLLQHGVYATFTGEPGRNALMWAAVLRAGPDAALSHESAAELFTLLDQPAPLIHVTIPEVRRVCPAPGLVTHRSGRIGEAVHPALTPPRTRIEETVLDLAAQAETFDAAFGIVAAGVQRGLTTPAHLTEAMGKRAKLRWRTALTEILREVSDGAHSTLEYRYVHRVERRHGLPAATRQARISDKGRSRYLDNLYGEFGLCVELDGLLAHPDGQRWHDLRRINAITEQGMTVLRYGWIDIDRRSCQVAAQVALVLRRLGWPGQARYCGATCGARRLDSA